MATFKSDQIAISAGAKYAPQGVLYKQCTVTMATGMTTNDVFQCLLIPGGAILLNWGWSALASVATTFTASVGDGTTAAKFVASATFGGAAMTYVGITSGAAGVLPFATPAAGFTLTITGVSLVGPVNTATATLWVEYSMDA